MATAGYSKTPLVKKLGIKELHRVLLVNEPKGFRRTLGELPAGVEVKTNLRGSRKFDVLLLFVKNYADLKKRFDKMVNQLGPHGGLWVAWPKKSSGVPTDLDFAAVQQHGLAAGLVDNKVCAVDETWSGLRFVYRIKDRPKKAK